MSKIKTLHQLIQANTNNAESMLSLLNETYQAMLAFDYAAMDKVNNEVNKLMLVTERDQTNIELIVEELGGKCIGDIVNKLKEGASKDVFSASLEKFHLVSTKCAEHLHRNAELVISQHRLCKSELEAMQLHIKA